MKLKYVYKQIVRENREEEIQLYLDVIADDPNNSRLDKYKEILWSEYGVDWKKEIKDDDYLNSVDLDNIKEKTDFRNWDTYVKYAKEVYAKRKLGDPRLSVSKEIPIDYVRTILAPLGIEVEFREYSGEGNYAQHISGKIQIPDPCDLGTLIHEIGHEFDEKVYKEGVSKKNTNASSSYMIGNVGEVFAENFMHYFLASGWLKGKLPEVWDDLNNKIPSKWKNIVNKLIDYTPL
jgi:hypothetical protein